MLSETIGFQQWLNIYLIPNALAISLFAIAVFIAVRALYLYFRARNPRLFILGLSMGLIALTAAADFVGSNVTSISLLLLSFGYFTIATQYSFLPSQGVFLDNVGDLIRLFGLITLLGAVVTG